MSKIFGEKLDFSGCKAGQAKEYAAKAIKKPSVLEESPAKSALIKTADFIADRVPV